MIIISYLLAGLIVLVRVCVPVSMTVLGGWPVRLLLFFSWVLAIMCGGNLKQFTDKLKSRRMEVACYASWIGILMFFFLMQGGEDLLTMSLVNVYIGTIPFYFLGTYYSIDQGWGRNMALATGLVVGVSCLMAIPPVWRDPSLVRMGAIASTAETRSLGIGSYGDLTGFAIALPFFITVSLQSKHIFRLIGIASCIAIMAFLMIATLSGLILLTGMAVTGCVLYYLLLGGIRWRRIILTPLAILVIAWAVMFIFPSIYERVEIGRFYDKLANTFTSLGDIISGKKTDPTQRYSLMLDSLQVFLDNPVIGAGLDTGVSEKESRGGHSSWMDALALYGLFGGVPYLMFHFLIFRRLWQAWRSERQNALYWGCLFSCVLYIFYGFFNVTTQGTTIALFLYATAGGQRLKAPANHLVPVLVRPRVKPLT